MYDIIFPNSNEQEFIRIAEKLGYDELIMVYPLEKFNRNNIDSKIKIKKAIFIGDKTINKAKNISDIVLVKAREDSRQIIEHNKNMIIFDFELSDRKDFIHQRRSGLNHILCNLANKNSITIGFSFSSLLNADPNQRKIILGRMKSNIKLCKKHKNKLVFCSFAKDPYEMRSSRDLKNFLS